MDKIGLDKIIQIKYKKKGGGGTFFVADKDNL
jgi:hypothetical protein